VSGNKEVELKGGMYTFMSLKLHTNDLSVIDTRLGEKVQQAPGFFKDSPVVVDLSDIEAGLEDGETFDTAHLFNKIRSHKLIPIVASITDKNSAFASSIALPLVEAGTDKPDRQTKQSDSSKDETTDNDQTSDNAKADGAKADGESSDSSTESSESSDSENSNNKSDSDLDLAPAKQIEVQVKAPKLVNKPVRSGQQVYAADTDLIIMGQVGAGAEVIASQNIHVYGPLRGRALCGISGNTSTRIFCQSLEAELVSVAGIFRVLEEIPEELRGKPAQIWLDKDKLNIEPL